jgi:hypothetical protein
MKMNRIKRTDNNNKTKLSKEMKKSTPFYKVKAASNVIFKTKKNKTKKNYFTPKGQN